MTVIEQVLEEDFSDYGMTVLRPVTFTGRWKIVQRSDRSCYRMYVEVEDQHRFLWWRWTATRWLDEIFIIFKQEYINDCN